MIKKQQFSTHVSFSLNNSDQASLCVLLSIAFFGQSPTKFIKILLNLLLGNDPWIRRKSCIYYAFQSILIVWL